MAIHFYFLKLFYMFPVEVHILVLGLYGAGKTTFLRNLRVGEVITTTPASGFNVERVTYQNVNFISWDVGGSDEMHEQWRQHFQNVDGIIYVVDSNDRDRIDESRDELAWLLSEDELNDCFLMVMANKQDLPNAMSLNTVANRLGLNLLLSRTWSIEGTSNIYGDGEYELLWWVKNTLIERAQSN